MLNIANYYRNVNQNYNEISFIPVNVAIIKKNPQRINAGESVELREPSYNVGGNANWHSHYGEQYAGFSKNLKVQLPYDFAIPSLGRFLKKIMVQKDICTPRVCFSAVYNS